MKIIYFEKIADACLPTHTRRIYFADQNLLLVSEDRGLGWSEFIPQTEEHLVEEAQQLAQNMFLKRKGLNYQNIKIWDSVMDLTKLIENINKVTSLKREINKDLAKILTQAKRTVGLDI